MNKNSLKQMIVAEMIYADARKLMNESHKKRSLFEMMDDDYLAELDDRKFVHSMKMMLEAGADDWDIAHSDNPYSGDKSVTVAGAPKPAPVVKPVAAPDTGMIDDAPKYSDLPLSSAGGEPAEFAPDSLRTSTDHGEVMSSPEDSGIEGSTAPADGTVNDSQPLYTDDLNNPVIAPGDGGAGGWVDAPDDADNDDEEVVEPDEEDVEPGEEDVEPVVEPGEEDDDSTIITIDGTKYYDGLKYLNKISDEMPAVAAESRLSLVDALYG